MDKRDEGYLDINEIECYIIAMIRDGRKNNNSVKVVSIEFFDIEGVKITDEFGLHADRLRVIADIMGTTEQEVIDCIIASYTANNPYNPEPTAPIGWGDLDVSPSDLL